MTDTVINFRDMYKETMTVLTGDFPVVVDSVVHDKPSQNGKPMLRCKLKITAGPYAGRTINHMFTLSVESENSKAMFFRHLAVLGADEAFFMGNPAWSVVASQITNRHAIVTLAEDEYNGVKKEKVTGWKVASAAQVAAAGIAGGGGIAAQATSLPSATATVAADPTTPPDDPF